MRAAARIGLLSCALAAVAPAWGHGDTVHEPKPEPAATPVLPRVDAHGHALPAEPALRHTDGSVFVPKSLQRLLGLRTELARSGDFPQMLELAGRVVADPAAGGQVQALQPGRLLPPESGMPVLGQRVRRGELLAWLEPAPDALAGGAQQAALAELEAQHSALARRAARLALLEGSVPQKDIEQAQIELAALVRRRAALQASLARAALRAPADGVIAATAAVAGQVVEARTPVFEIVDPARLAVEAAAYDPALLAGVAQAHAVAGDATLALDFVGIGRSLKAQALPMLFRVRVPADGAPPLALGQPLKVLAATRARQTGIAVPLAAVVRNTNNEPVVWVHERAEQFVPHKVGLAPLDGARLLVTDGLAGGERVVVRGAAALGQIR